MILVISKCNDISTDYFMEWCDYLGTPVLRVNENSINPVHHIYLSGEIMSLDFEVNGRRYHLDDVDAVWFRRGYVYHYAQPVAGLPEGNLPAEITSVDGFLKNENSTLNDFFIHCLKRKNGINEPSRYNANKLVTLMEASGAGLKIPPTLIVKDRETVARYKNNLGPGFITKPIQDSLWVCYEDDLIVPVIKEMDRDAGLEEHFFYSKIQEHIFRKYEIRTFFIGDNFYSCAVFSGSAACDYKERIVPFALPEAIKEKLEKLVDKLGYESGSIDMLVDEQDTYYFLEINPVGQYDFVSRNCNFYLDYEIAQFFTKHYEKHTHPPHG